MCKINPSLFLTRNKNVSWTELNAKIVLINIKNNNFYTLNETGALIWKWATGKYTVEKLIEKLAEEYSVPMEKVKKNIFNLISNLLKEKLVFLNQEPYN